MRLLVILSLTVVCFVSVVGAAFAVYGGKRIPIRAAPWTV